MATLEEVSKLLDMTGRRVQQLVTEGVLPRPTGRGEYAAGPCVVAYIRYLRKQAQGTGDKSLTDERTRLAKEQADKLALENRMLRGEVVDIEDGAELFGEVVEILRTKILGLGDRLAVHVAGVSDVREAKGLIDDHAEELLSELSALDLRRAVRVPASPSGADGEVQTSTAPSGE